MNAEINTIEKALKAMSIIDSSVDDAFRWQMLRLALTYIAEQMGCDIDKAMNN